MISCFVAKYLVPVLLIAGSSHSFVVPSTIGFSSVSDAKHKTTFQLPKKFTDYDSHQVIDTRRTTTRNASDGVNEIRDDRQSDMLLAAVGVGAVSASMGFIYGKVLSATVRTVWTTFPAMLTNRFGIGTINPLWFITGTCTFGGLLMGILSSNLKSSFSVADFVSAFSSVPAQSHNLPQSRNSLLPLLILSLVTSTFGFSVGPEAPMVCAGGLVGASLARRWHDKFSSSSSSKSQYEETLAYAGAAGALTAFMGIPIAGSIFALELTRSSAGLSSGARDSLSPAVAASVAALVLIRAFFLPGKSVGGHFSYGAIGALSGRTMMIAAILSSVGGGVLGTVFHKTVKLLKTTLWTKKLPGLSSKDKPWKRTVLVKTMIGLVVGLLSSYYPQTLFWGEGSLQCVVDGQRTAFAATKHGLPSALTSIAKVNPSLPFKTSAAAAQVGVAKLIAIALACAGKFPGGIIFPLFFAAAPLAHACAGFVSAR